MNHPINNKDIDNNLSTNIGSNPYQFSIQKPFLSNSLSMNNFNTNNSQINLDYNQANSHHKIPTQSFSGLNSYSNNYQANYEQQQTSNIPNIATLSNYSIAEYTTSFYNTNNDNQNTNLYTNSFSQNLSLNHNIGTLMPQPNTRYLQPNFNDANKFNYLVTSDATNISKSSQDVNMMFKNTQVILSSKDTLSQSWNYSNSPSNTSSNNCVNHYYNPNNINNHNLSGNYIRSSDQVPQHLNNTNINQNQQLYRFMCNESSKLPSSSQCINNKLTFDTQSFSNTNAINLMNPDHYINVENKNQSNVSTFENVSSSSYVKSENYNRAPTVNQNDNLQYWTNNKYDIPYNESLNGMQSGPMSDRINNHIINSGTSNLKNGPSFVTTNSVTSTQILHNTSTIPYSINNKLSENVSFKKEVPFNNINNMLSTQASEDKTILNPIQSNSKNSSSDSNLSINYNEKNRKKSIESCSSEDLSEIEPLESSSDEDSNKQVYNDDEHEVDYDGEDYDDEDDDVEDDENIEESNEYQQQEQNKESTSYSSIDIKNLNSSFNRLHLQASLSKIIDLKQERIGPPDAHAVLEPSLTQDLKPLNCQPSIMGCTLNTVPRTSDILKKSNLPFAILLQPFSQHCTIERIPRAPLKCVSCFAYINAFVTIASGRWRCNMCHCTNPVPWDYASKTGTNKYNNDLFKMPEMNCGSIEYAIPYENDSEEAPIHIFLLDVSHNAISTGYIEVFCNIFCQSISKQQDKKGMVGFISFDTFVYMYALRDDLQVYTIPQLDDLELPAPDGFLVKWNDPKLLHFIKKLPSLHENNDNTKSAFGSALTIASKLLSESYGMVTVFLTQLPTIGDGQLKNREDVIDKNNLIDLLIHPASAFYKTMSLDFLTRNIGVDLFFLNSRYSDIATIANLSRYTGGLVYYFGGYHSISNLIEHKKFVLCLRAYFSEKMAYNAELKFFFTQGVSSLAYYGNSFVNSSDTMNMAVVHSQSGILAHLNVNTISDNIGYIVIQSQFSYTNYKGNRRMRVNTLCLPVSSSVSDIHYNANNPLIITTLAKLACERCINLALKDGIEGLKMAVIDILSCFSKTLQYSNLPCPHSLRAMPYSILSMLKSAAFNSIFKGDEKSYAFERCRSLTWPLLLKNFIPSFYDIQQLNNKENFNYETMLHLSVCQLKREGIFLLDSLDAIYLYIGGLVGEQDLSKIFDEQDYKLEGIIDLKCIINNLLRLFIELLMSLHPYPVPIIIIREESNMRHIILDSMLEDRTWGMPSYPEYVMKLCDEIKEILYK